MRTVLLLLAIMVTASDVNGQQYEAPRSRLSYSRTRGFYSPGFQGYGNAARNWTGPATTYAPRSVTRTRGGWMRFQYGQPVSWDIGGVGRFHYPWIGIR